MNFIFEEDNICQIENVVSKPKTMINVSALLISDLNENTHVGETIQEMKNFGHDIYLFIDLKEETPCQNRLQYITNNLNWIKNNLGDQWLDQVIISKEKNNMSMDFYISDKHPKKLSFHSDDCTHIVLNKKNENQKGFGRFMDDWKNWKSVMIKHD